MKPIEPGITEHRAGQWSVRLLKRGWRFVCEQEQHRRRNMGVVSHTLKVELETLECIQCGIPHAIPAQLYKSAARNGGWWHCPNGHSQGWEKGTEHTRIKQLERELEAERQRKTQALSEANSQRARADSLEKSSKAAAKRAAAGTCPCCKRTFQQLARHMKCKHPTYGKGVKK